MQGAAVTERAFGGPAYLERVFQEHQARVFRAAYRITGNAQDAEDVLQTVFLRLVRQGEGSLLANPAGYLYRAAINSAIDLLRARRERASVPLEEAEGAPVGSPPTPEQAQEAAEVRAWLRHALAGLPPRAAAVFALRYLEGQDNRDIARILGLSRVTVAVTLHRTRHRLQAALRLWRRGRP